MPSRTAKRGKGSGGGRRSGGGVHRDFNDVFKVAGFGGTKIGKRAALIKRKKVFIVRARDERSFLGARDPRRKVIPESHKGNTLKARMLRQLGGSMFPQRNHGKLAMVQLPTGARVHRYLNEYHLERMASEQTKDG